MILRSLSSQSRRVYGNLLNHGRLFSGTRICRKHNWTSNEVYSAFINFFSERDHKFIRSSSVVPWNDPSLFFVNAGMNQFKPILLGQSSPPYPRAVNSQKCIRAKGKHNDLADVGKDSYHHTFFEMLGSWSFGDYFKKESCTLAWTLMTEVYKLPPDRLYVTFFNGDETLNLPPDLETRQHWLDLGISPDHILPFGSKDNFWEMGLVGPCGPCTEIHYWRGPEEAKAAHLVNADNEDLVELWNIVFIQYERHEDQSVTKLSRHNVDTGMGLERLTATLNGKRSNYDTDLFEPLFETIRTVSGAAPYAGSFAGASHLDTAYRVIADHARMSVVAVSDGCLPTNNHVLRHILRRLFSTAKTHFNLDDSDGSSQKHWLQHLSSSVVTSLSQRHPSLTSSLPHVQNVLLRELQHYYQSEAALVPAWQALTAEEPPLCALESISSLPLVMALRQVVPLVKQSGDFIETEVAVRASIQFGFSLDLLQEIGRLYNKKIDDVKYFEELRRTKRQTSLKRLNHRENVWGCANLSRIQSDLASDDIAVTNRDSVYSYSRTLSSNLTGDENAVRVNDEFSYVYPDLETRVLAVIKDGEVSSEVKGSCEIGIVLRDSNFYTDSGGQIGDQGDIHLVNGSILSVKHVETAGDYIIHWGELNCDPSKSEDVAAVCAGVAARCRVCAERRLGLSRHHTATHMLHKAFSLVTGEPTQQLSSYITHNYLSFDVGSYKSIASADILEAQEIVQCWIKDSVPIERRVMPFSSALQEEGLVLLAGSVYPDTVSVVTVPSSAVPTSSSAAQGASVEVCCGTHMLNTADLHQFVITNVGSSEGVGVRCIRATCGPIADTLILRGQTALSELDEKLETAMENPSDSYKDETKKWAKILLKKGLPYEAKAPIQEFNNNINKVFRMQKEKGELRATRKELDALGSLSSSLTDGEALVQVIVSPRASHRNILKASYTLLDTRNSLIIVSTDVAFVAKAIVNDKSISLGASASDWLGLLQKYYPESVVTPGTNPASLATFRADLKWAESLALNKDKINQDFTEYIKKFMVKDER